MQGIIFSKYILQAAYQNILDAINVYINTMQQAVYSGPEDRCHNTAHIHMAIPFFIPEKEGIIHTAVNNSSWPMCVPHQTVPEFAWEGAFCYSKKYVLRGIWATKQSDIAYEPDSRPA